MSAAAATNKKKRRSNDAAPQVSGSAAAAAAAAPIASSMADGKDAKQSAAAAASSSSSADGGSARKMVKKAPKQAASDKPAGLKEEDEEELAFQDQFPDDVDSEDEEALKEIEALRIAGKPIGDAADSDDETEEAVRNAEAGILPKAKKRVPANVQAAAGSSSSSSDANAKMGDNEEEDDDDDTGESRRQPATKVWQPADGLGEDEKLEYDSKFYSCYHAMKADWPCLSFDIIRDKYGELRTKFPQSMYFVTGTQAERGKDNKILVMKVSDIHRTKHEDDDGEDDNADDEDDEADDDAKDDDPLLYTQTIDVDGEVNRIRSMPQQSNFIASWQSTGKVHIWNASQQLAALDKDSAVREKKIPTQPVFTFQHTYEEKSKSSSVQGSRMVRKPTEGFALDWSGTSAGRLATGDCHGGLYVWDFKESTWQVDGNSFKGHTSSVEDIQWSPNEPNVFATCSADKTIRIWDTRESKKQSIRWVVGHKSDVNVISWNKKTPAFLVSGSDDASIKIWDFRKFTSNTAIAHFKYHTGPITSVEWHPHEDSVFAASSADHSISVWDLALERDADFKPEGASLNEAEYPAQLYFVHAGQKDIKEVHFHPQVPALMLSTAADGFNIFKPANMELTPQQLQILSQPYKQAAATAAATAAAAAAAGTGAATATATAAAPATAAAAASPQK